MRADVEVDKPYLCILVHEVAAHQPHNVLRGELAPVDRCHGQCTPNKRIDSLVHVVVLQIVTVLDVRIGATSERIALHDTAAHSAPSRLGRVARTEWDSSVLRARPSWQTDQRIPAQAVRGIV